MTSFLHAVQAVFSIVMLCTIIHMIGSRAYMAMEQVAHKAFDYLWDKAAPPDDDDL